jgi:hypothetical protein
MRSRAIVLGAAALALAAGLFVLALTGRAGPAAPTTVTTKVVTPKAPVVVTTTARKTPARRSKKTSCQRDGDPTGSDSGSCGSGDDQAGDGDSGDSSGDNQAGDGKFGAHDRRTASSHSRDEPPSAMTWRRLLLWPPIECPSAT